MTDLLDQTPIEQERPRFFALGQSCPWCRYPLQGSTPGICPECGFITVDLAYEGILREMTPIERERAEGGVPPITRGAVLARATQDLNTLAVLGLLAALLLFVVAPLLARAGANTRPGPTVVTLAGGVLIFVVFVAAQFGISWRKLRRDAERRRRGLVEDLERGEVEEFHYQVTHAMQIPSDSGDWLILRLRGGAVLRLTGAGRAAVGMETGKPVREHARVGRTPRSMQVVSFECLGEVVPAPLRPELALQRKQPGPGEPITGAASVAALVRPDRSTSPPFAPQGPQTVKHDPG